MPSTATLKNYLDLIHDMPTKQIQYAELVAARKKCRRCDGLCNPNDKTVRRFDSNEIGPWSILHGDLKARLMIVGQDWGDVDYFVKNKGRDDLKNRTMRNLQSLLERNSLSFDLQSYSEMDRGLFLTNAVLCLKSDGMTSKIDRKWVKNCGNSFLRRQIEIVRPRIVVGMGKLAFHAILRAFDMPVVALNDAIHDRRGIEIQKSVRLFACYHCSPGTISRNRDLRQQTLDWKRIAIALNR
jgi:DNA polymerase